MIENRVFDLVVIGGGTAALTAISEALNLGISRIALLEKRDQLGGECIQNACIPTKTLLSASRLMKQISERAPEYGIFAESVFFDFEKLRDKEEFIIRQKIQAADAIREDNRVTILHGEASFISKREIKVKDTVIRGEKVIIATGAEPVIPAIGGLDVAGFLTFHQASHIEILPKSMVIIGGGPVGVEYAQIFHSLGCQVAILEKGPRLLPSEEPEISVLIEDFFKRDGIFTFTQCDIQSVHPSENFKNIDFQIHGEQKTIQAEAILVAVGMKPRVNGLQLEAAGVQVEQNGIVVNDERQTTCENIWAIGDVTGSYRFTHVADYEAVIATRNAVNNTHEKVDFRAVPWAIYTEPIVAHVGLTEQQAKEHYANVIVLRMPVDSTSGFQVESHTQGFIKLIIDGDTHQLVGGHLLSHGADDIAQTLVLAIQNQMTVAQLKNMMYIFPAKAQIIEKALEAYLQGKVQSSLQPVSQR